MPYLQNLSQTVTTLLAADVANSGTVTLSYPAGTSQLDFNAGLAGPNSVAWYNGDKLASNQFSLSFGASNITFTNSTGATMTAGSTLVVGLDQQDGNAVEFLNFSVNLADIAAADLMTDFRPGIDGTIEYIQFVATKAATTASKAATLTPKINTVAITGGAIALTSANMTPGGAIVAATPTAANVLTRTSKLTVTGSLPGAVPFVEGAGFLSFRIRRNAATV